jgi:transposase
MTPESKTLDHLGLVAAMCDELQIASSIDARIAQDLEQRHLSIGLAVKAMILNGLGFVNQRLYLTPHFFQTKPTEHLLGPGILPEHLNDDTLGRTLDALYDYGVTELFRDLAARAALLLGLDSRFLHLDATSFHVDGRYNSADEDLDDKTIHIRTGYSRDHRPELNQVVLELIVENQAGLPVLMKPLSGNSNDAADFPKIIAAHIDQLQQAHGTDFIVADAALYSKDHVQALGGAGTHFISRVPQTINEAKEALSRARLEQMRRFDGDESLGTYRYEPIGASYGGVAQRWLVIHSEQAAARAQKSKSYLRKSEKEAKAFRALLRKPFACPRDAEQALARFEASLAVSELASPSIVATAHYGKQGRPGRDAVAVMRYQVAGHLSSSLSARSDWVWQQSLFIVATNLLDETVLSDAELVRAYKGQSGVERGFRFLKDPLFLASSMYLKKPSRVMALLFVMTLCLLVYAALEWRIREGLVAEQVDFVDQRGKPTRRPTARWVFQYFVGIHVLHQGEQWLVLNLNTYHKAIINVLGPDYERLYSAYPT